MEAKNSVVYDTKSHRLCIIKDLKNIKRICAKEKNPLLSNHLHDLKQTSVLFFQEIRQRVVLLKDNHVGYKDRSRIVRDFE